MSLANKKVEGKPHLVLFYCQHTVKDHLALTTDTVEQEGVVIRPVPVACSSKVQAEHLLQLLDSGTDGIEVVVCPAEACKQLVGSRRAEKRVAYARSLLAAAGLEQERLGISQHTGLTNDELLAAAMVRAAALKAGSPHPVNQGGVK
jgi:coenzyme F420-reducing hydrogenase delta subunit